MARIGQGLEDLELCAHVLVSLVTLSVFRLPETDLSA